MAVVKRTHKDGSATYKVQWRLGGSRDGRWQSETFAERRAALKFQSLVEAHGQRWPDGWIKGIGFGTPAQEAAAPAEHLLSTFGAEYVRRLTSAGPDTQTRYLKQVETLVAWIWETRGSEPTIENLTTDDDQDWIVARRRAGASPKTISNYHGLLSAIMKSAVAKALISRNPCEGVKLPPLDDGTEEDEDKIFLTEQEFGLVHSCIDEDSKDLLLVDVGTGLRWGELTALKVKDVDLQAEVPTLTVRRAWKRNGSGEFALSDQGRFYLGKPKTRESRRRVTLAPTVGQALARAMEGLAPEALIFTSPRGGRLDQGNWYESRWQRAVQAARKRGLVKAPRFHDLRHTHAAWLISAGVPLPVIQKRLGHKSIQITVDVYGGLLFQTHEIADMAIERALGGQQIVTLAQRGSVEAAEFLCDDEQSA
jgi:integrase